MFLPVMARRMGWRWFLGLPALGAVIAFIVLAGSCDRTWSGDGISFKYPSHARIAVQYEYPTCEQGETYCPNLLLVTDERSGSALWIDSATGAEFARGIRTENDADPADVNDLFDRIAGSVRIEPGGDQ